MSKTSAISASGRRVMFKKEVTNLIASRTSLERQTKDGDSPVGESDQTSLLWGQNKVIVCCEISDFRVRQGR